MNGVNIIGRVEASIRERVRAAARRHAVRTLLVRHEIDGPWEDSYEALSMLTSIKAVVRDIPPILVDVGAHKGRFTQGGFQILGFKQALCIEPDGSLYSELRARLRSNKVAFRQVALADKLGRRTLYVHQSRDMNSLVPSDADLLRERFLYDRRGVVAREPVDAMTLDVVLSEEGLLESLPLFIKLDTQGTELNILRGATRTLEFTHALLVEFMFLCPYVRDFTFLELIEFLNTHGFECRGAVNTMKVNSGEVSGVDFLFVKSHFESEHSNERTASRVSAAPGAHTSERAGK